MQQLNLVCAKFRYNRQEDAIETSLHLGPHKSNTLNTLIISNLCLSSSTSKPPHLIFHNGSPSWACKLHGSTTVIHKLSSIVFLFSFLTFIFHKLRALLRRA